MTRWHKASFAPVDLGGRCCSQLCHQSLCLPMPEAGLIDHLSQFLCRLKASQLELGLIVASMLVPEGPGPEHRVLTGHPDAPRAHDWGLWSPLEVRALSPGPGPV